MREVNPFALFCVSSIMGNAVYGWVNPNIVNDNWFVWKLAFLVTESKQKILLGLSLCYGKYIYYKGVADKLSMSYDF